MLHEEHEDPLNSSIFDTTNTSSVLGNTVTNAFNSAALFSSQFEEDPWGNHSNPVRSLTTPNFYAATKTHTISPTTVLCKF